MKLYMVYDYYNNIIYGIYSNKEKSLDRLKNLSDNFSFPYITSLNYEKLDVNLQGSTQASIMIKEFNLDEDIKDIDLK